MTRSVLSPLPRSSKSSQPMVGALKSGSKKVRRSCGKRLAQRTEEDRGIFHFTRFTGEFCRNALHQKVTHCRCCNVFNENDLVLESGVRQPLIGKTVGELNTYLRLLQKASDNPRFVSHCKKLVMNGLHSSNFCLHSATVWLNHC